jgi:bacillithiol system protein YtxJ
LPPHGVAAARSLCRYYSVSIPAAATARRLPCRSTGRIEESPRRFGIANEEPSLNEPATTEFVTIPDADGVSALRDRPGLTLLYLHDPWCPISSRAFRQLDSLGGDVRIVDVDAHPELAPAVEAMTGVRHESPQIILLRDGAPIWSASHFAITTDAVRRALAHAEGV